MEKIYCFKNFLLSKFITLIWSQRPRNFTSQWIFHNIFQAIRINFRLFFALTFIRHLNFLLFNFQFNNSINGITQYLCGKNGFFTSINIKMCVNVSIVIMDWHLQISKSCHVDAKNHFVTQSGIVFTWPLISKTRT